jgi:transcriptional regulator
MYRPKIFQGDNVDKLVAFMQAHSFSTLVSILDGVPFASHLPLVVTREQDEIKLLGHFAKQNPHSQTSESSESLAIFTGAHAYVSPTLYQKHESVPTWNYITVHAYGVIKYITFHEAPESMNKMINTMIHTYEESYQAHWDGLSSEYRTGMMNGIVGFELTVTRLEGKYKLSQNRCPMEQENVSHALLHSSDPIARVVGMEMKNHKFSV